MDYQVKFQFTEWSKSRKGFAMGKSGTVELNTDASLEELEKHPPELLNFLADEMEKLVKGVVPAGMIKITEIKQKENGTSKRRKTKN